MSELTRWQAVWRQAYSLRTWRISRSGEWWSRKSSRSLTRFSANRSRGNRSEAAANTPVRP